MLYRCVRILFFIGCDWCGSFSCFLSLFQRYFLVGRGARVRGENPKRTGGNSQARIPPFPFRFSPRAPLSSFPFPLVARHRIYEMLCRIRVRRFTQFTGFTRFTPLPCHGYTFLFSLFTFHSSPKIRQAANAKRMAHAFRGERITEGRAREGNPKERGECELASFPSFLGVSLSHSRPCAQLK